MNSRTLPALVLASLLAVPTLELHAQGRDLPSAPSEGGLAAIVGDEVITYGDLDREVEQAIAAELGDQPISAADIARWRPLVRKLKLDEMIEKSLMLQEARKDGIEVRPQQIDEQINKEISDLRNEGKNIRDADEFYDSLQESQGITREQYRQKTREQIITNILLWSKAFRPEFITPGELREFYQARRAEFQKASSFKFRMILLPPTDDILERMQFIDQSLGRAAPTQREAVFAELARRFSAVRADSGGLWERSTEELEDSWPPQVRQALFSMKVGEIRPRIRTQRGFNYLYMVEVEKGEAEPFEKVQEKIKRQILTRRRLEDQKRFVAQLREKYPVKIFLPDPESTSNRPPPLLERVVEKEKPPVEEPPEVQDVSEEAEKKPPVRKDPPPPVPGSGDAPR